MKFIVGENSFPTGHGQFYQRDQLFESPPFAGLARIEDTVFDIPDLVLTCINNTRTVAVFAAGDDQNLQHVSHLLSQESKTRF